VLEATWPLVQNGQQLDMNVLVNHASKPQKTTTATHTIANSRNLGFRSLALLESSTIRVVQRRWFSAPPAELQRGEFWQGLRISM
jgi:hypothetical protein